MKKTILYTFLFLSTLATAVYAHNTSDHRKTDTPTTDTIVVFPIHGTMKISDNGFIQYKQVEFWIHDARGKEVYNVVQALPTGEAFQDKINEMIDKEYINFMRMHGFAIKSQMRDLVVIQHEFSHKRKNVR